MHGQKNIKLSIVGASQRKRNCCLLDTNDRTY